LEKTDLIQFLKVVYLLKDSKLDSSSRIQIDLIQFQLLLRLLLPQGQLQQLLLLHNVLRCQLLLLLSSKGLHRTSGITSEVPLIGIHRTLGVI
jgi:hypothetical protein